jgi:hypothetical protein
VAAKPPTTRPIALEGEKDIDQRNAKTLYFHIDGGVPDFVTLYLRAGQFSSLYYTELGGHTHPVAITTTDTVLNLKHTHAASAGDTDEAPDHTHNYLTDGGERTGGIDVNDDQVIGRTNTDQSAILPAGKHSHKLVGLTLDDALQDAPHHHDVNGATQSAGATNQAVHSGGSALSYLNKVTVLYDGQDITAAIVTQISGAYPAWSGIAQLGDGTANSPLVAKSNGSGGTGAINLDRLGLDFSPGQHSLTFKVADSSGGQIQYNLYVG